MTIEKNDYLTVLKNKVVYHQVFQIVQQTNKYQRFFTQNNIEVDGSAIRFLLTWPKEGKKFKIDLSIHNTADDFKRTINIAKFDLPKIFDEVFYEMINEERFMEALDSPQTCKILTQNLLEQAANYINIKIEEAIPQIICQDSNFIPYDETTKKGNLYEAAAEKFDDPIWIHEQLFNGSSILTKRTTDFNKGYYDKDEATWKPLTTNISSYDKMIVLLDSTVRNKTIIGGYRENVNFNKLDLESRFGKENIYEDNLPNGYKMGVMDERSFQLYQKNKEVGFRNKEEAETGNQWFFLNPVIHGGFITGLNALFWKVKGKEEETTEDF